MEKIDRETAENATRNTELRRMTESEGWKVAKGMLLQRVALLDSVSSLPPELSFDEIGKQAMFRAHAISLVRTWLDEIDGHVDQDSQQSEVLIDLQETTVVRHYS